MSVSVLMMMLGCEADPTAEKSVGSVAQAAVASCDWVASEYIDNADGCDCPLDGNTSCDPDCADNGATSWCGCDFCFDETVNEAETPPPGWEGNESSDPVDETQAECAGVPGIYVGQNDGCDCPLDGTTSCDPDCADNQANSWCGCDYCYAADGSEVEQAPDDGSNAEEPAPSEPAPAQELTASCDWINPEWVIAGDQDDTECDCPLDGNPACDPDCNGAATGDAWCGCDWCHNEDGNTVDEPPPGWEELPGSESPTESEPPVESDPPVDDTPDEPVDGTVEFGIDSLMLRPESVLDELEIVDLAFAPEETFNASVDVIWNLMDPGNAGVRERWCRQAELYLSLEGQLVYVHTQLGAEEIDVRDSLEKQALLAALICETDPVGLSSDTVPETLKQSMRDVVRTLMGLGLAINEDIAEAAGVSTLEARSLTKRTVLLMMAELFGVCGTDPEEVLDYIFTGNLPGAVEGSNVLFKTCSSSDTSLPRTNPLEQFGPVAEFTACMDAAHATLQEECNDPLADEGATAPPPPQTVDDACPPIDVEQVACEPDALPGTICFEPVEPRPDFACRNSYNEIEQLATELATALYDLHFAEQEQNEARAVGVLSSGVGGILNPAVGIISSLLHAYVVDPAHSEAILEWQLRIQEIQRDRQEACEEFPDNPYCTDPPDVNQTEQCPPEASSGVADPSPEQGDSGREYWDLVNGCICDVVGGRASPYGFVLCPETAAEREERECTEDPTGPDDGPNRNPVCGKYPPPGGDDAPTDQSKDCWRKRCVDPLARPSLEFAACDPTIETCSYVPICVCASDLTTIGSDLPCDLDDLAYCLDDACLCAPTNTEPPWGNDPDCQLDPSIWPGSLRSMLLARPERVRVHRVAPDKKLLVFDTYTGGSHSVLTAAQYTSTLEQVGTTLVQEVMVVGPMASGQIGSVEMYCHNPSTGLDGGLLGSYPIFSGAPGVLTENRMSPDLSVLRDCFAGEAHHLEIAAEAAAEFLGLGRPTFEGNLTTPLSPSPACPRPDPFDFEPGVNPTLAVASGGSVEQGQTFQFRSGFVREIPATLFMPRRTCPASDVCGSDCCGAGEICLDDRVCADSSSGSPQPSLPTNWPPECLTDGDCSVGAVCEDGSCVSKTFELPPCVEDCPSSDPPVTCFEYETACGNSCCASFQECVDGVCISPPPPPPSSCPGNPALACDTFADCSGNVCPGGPCNYCNGCCNAIQ
jgi:hypothetical protein